MNDTKIKLNLLKLLKESTDALEQQPTKLTKLERKAFLESCKQYGNAHESIYRSGNINEIVSEIGNLVNLAEQVTLQETENWFDGVTVSRHMKQLREAFKIFEKTGTELHNMQQRFESSYEDIGEVLSKYYDVQ